MIQRHAWHGALGCIDMLSRTSSVAYTCYVDGYNMDGKYCKVW